MTQSLAIELCDPGLRAATQAGPLGEPSPGYALLEGRDLAVGREAQSQSRLRPRWVDNRFWDRVDEGAMPRPFPRALSRADVVHTHLSGYWSQLQGLLAAGAEETSVLLAVPGAFSVDQLGLILGIARAAGMPVAGIVDAALVGVLGQAEALRVLHLDILLHRWVVTELVGTEQLARRRVEMPEGGGLVRVWDVWARRIAELLVRRTRFDPFHHGRAEQALYDQLPACLQELSRAGHTTISLDADGTTRSVEVDGSDVAAVAVGLTAPVQHLVHSLSTVGDPAVVALSARAAAVPGLVHALSDTLEAPMVELPGASALEGVLRHRQLIEAPGSELPLIVQLPREVSGSAAGSTDVRPRTVVAAEGEGSIPTHLLRGETAFSITQEPLLLGSAAVADGTRGIRVAEAMPGLSRRHCTVRLQDGRVLVEDSSRYGTYLNGVRVRGRAIARVGDRLRLGSPGVELLFIEVDEGHV